MTLNKSAGWGPLAPAALPSKPFGNRVDDLVLATRAGFAALQAELGPQGVAGELCTINAHLLKIDPRFAALNTTLNHVSAGLERIESGLAALKASLGEHARVLDHASDDVRKQLEGIASRFDRLNDNLQKIADAIRPPREGPTPKK